MDSFAYEGFSRAPFRMRLWSKLCFESRCILIVGFSIGTIGIIVVPPVVTFDGPSHYFRAEQISIGQFRASRYSDTQFGGQIPANSSNFVGALWSSYWVDHRFLTLSDWSRIDRESGGSATGVRREFTNSAVYSPANYLPQSCGMLIVRIFTQSPLWAHRAACGANLVAYLLLMALVLEAMPPFRTALLLVATSPLLLLQAATESIDALNFAFPMLLVAMVWRIWNQPALNHRITLRGLLLLSLYIALLKPTNVACLGLLLFLPTAAFGSPRNKVIWLVATLVLSTGVWLAWNAAYLDVNVAGWYDPKHPAVSEQKAWLLRHPADFVGTFWSFLRRELLVQWEYSYSGIGGWVSGRLQFFLQRLSDLILGILVVAPICFGKRDLRWSSLCAMMAVGVLAFIALTLWVSYGVKHEAYIPYLGGRYLFVPFMFAVMAWSSLFNGPRDRPRRWAILLGLSINLVGLSSVLMETARITVG